MQFTVESVLNELNKLEVELSEAYDNGSLSLEQIDNLNNKLLILNKVRDVILFKKLITDDKNTYDNAK